jgi:branched-chain amino acid transport system permease protein
MVGAMRRRFLVLAGLLPVLTGCAGVLDPQQRDVCQRVLPALHAEGAQLREIGIAPAKRTPALRIDYVAREPGEENRTHFVVCRFGGGRLDANRLDLVAVETDQGALGEARLLYLKRFWLAPQAEAGRETVVPDVPQLPAQVAYGLQQSINALALAAIYALLATSYSLIYGLVGRINLAFGELAVIGAYAAIAGVVVPFAFGFNHAAIGLMLALMAAAAAAALASGTIGARVIAPLHERHRSGQPILVATAAVAISVQEFLRLFQGAGERWLPVLFGEPIALARAGSFVVTVTPVQILVAVSALLAAVALVVVMLRTQLGREWRAFADDPTAASMLGVAPRRILGAAFMLAGASAGFAGWIVAVYYGNVGFTMGTTLGLKALLAAIVGGIGRVEGALLGGVIIGLLEAGWSAYFDIALRDMVMFFLLVIVFVLRPGGLLGFSGSSPREV